MSCKQDRLTGLCAEEEITSALNAASSVLDVAGEEAACGRAIKVVVALRS